MALVIHFMYVLSTTITNVSSLLFRQVNSIDQVVGWLMARNILMELCFLFFGHPDIILSKSYFYRNPFQILLSFGFSSFPYINHITHLLKKRFSYVDCYSIQI